ncbi:MAG: LysR family transcriptional regulator [Treponema sp.]|jgi:DNA-binding transcriptional LysR family regulator|nr:LysR family transcriptional regulator [Treponema sp.]
MNDRHLKYILEIAKQGSITAAAENLYISQPSLSSLLAIVEEELGARIFDRSRVPLTLTCEGEQYVEAAAKILGTIRDMQARINDMKESISGRFNIDCGPQQSPFVIPQLLPVLMKKYPKVEFKFEESDQSHREKFLLNGMLDMVLTTGKINHANVECIPVRKQEMLLFTPSDFTPPKLTPVPDRSYPCVDLGSLGPKRFVLMKKRHRIRTAQDAILNDNGYVPLTILETDNLQTCIRMVESGFSFTLLPHIKSEMDRTRANKYSFKDDYRQTLYLCYRRNTYYSRIMEGVINAAVELLSDEVVPNPG